jgi:uncharacterized protein YdiU (UPF0061 family)
MNKNLLPTNKYNELPDNFYQNITPEGIEEPSLFFINEELKNTFPALQSLGNKDLLNFASGNISDSHFSPTALAYSGHQFGSFTTLGDGRAVVLGQITNENSELFDAQLKGSGRTKYSRGGDGKLSLSSAMREYLYSEAMFHLKIPTTRALSVIKTNQKVYRDSIQNGGVLLRLAKSLIRVGTIEFASYQNSKEDFQAILQFVLEHYFPELKNTKNPYLSFFKQVLHLQTSLIVHWFRVGFIHGVMNTDNVSIVGETIDYGPCAFLNEFNPGAVFSKIDVNGRYAFQAQANITHFNLSCLANALIPLIDKDEKKAIKLLQKELDTFSYLYSNQWLKMMRQKIGITTQGDDYPLVSSLLNLMKENELDYTNTFNFLRELPVPDSVKFDSLNDWIKDWRDRLSYENFSFEEQKIVMAHTNPVYIPRNIAVENVLTEIEENENTEPFVELINVLKKPYDFNPQNTDYMTYSKEYDSTYTTHCNT